VQRCSGARQEPHTNAFFKAAYPSHVGPVVFLGDEPPVPTQDRVGCHDPGHSRQAASAEKDAFHGQAAALVVGEAQPSGSVRGAQDPVLLEEVVDDRLLLPVHPARDQQEQEGERARPRVHGGSVSQRAIWFKVRRLIPGAQIRSAGTSLSAEYSYSTDCRPMITADE
jgi:hypothetical protein